MSTGWPFLFNNVLKIEIMEYNPIAVKLADFIEANKSLPLKFNIDNDCWDITEPGKEEDEDFDFLARSEDYQYSTDWYSHSSNHGAALAEAMVILLNRNGYTISASAV